VEFRILGPVEVLDAQGRRLALGGPKQRALLAVLLLHAGEVVGVEWLVDELWGEDPPEGAVQQLHDDLDITPPSTRLLHNPQLATTMGDPGRRSLASRSGRRGGHARPTSCSSPPSATTPP
jgi:hypothetical protein